MRVLFLLPLLVGWTACERRPNVPQTVTVVVEKFKPLPEWATAQVPNVPPANGSVEALKDANNARAGTIDYVNCRSRLLARIDKGEQVSPKECRK